MHLTQHKQVASKRRVRISGTLIITFSLLFSLIPELLAQPATVRVDLPRDQPFIETFAECMARIKPCQNEDPERGYVRCGYVAACALENAGITPYDSGYGFIFDTLTKDCEDICQSDSCWTQATHGYFDENAPLPVISPTDRDHPYIADARNPVCYAPEPAQKCSTTLTWDGLREVYIETDPDTGEEHWFCKQKWKCLCKEGEGDPIEFPDQEL